MRFAGAQQHPAEYRKPAQTYTQTGTLPLSQAINTCHAAAMPHYRRPKLPGATYFVTVTLQDRRRDHLVRHIDELRAAYCHVQTRHPFESLAAVVLPDHLHCLWRLPPGDHDLGTRWALIKARFSRRIAAGEVRSASRCTRRERGIWQRRYWEHLIRNRGDLQAHFDYIHFNPVKHGHVQRAADWPHSSIHHYIRNGHIAPDWGIADRMMDSRNKGE